jgi:hypothetical protein
MGRRAPVALPTGCDDLRMRTRHWLIVLGVAAGIVAMGGAITVGWQERSSQAIEHERTRNDDTVRSYLQSLTEGNYDSAYALVCTDETGTDRNSFEHTEREDPIRSFQIQSSVAWSSWVDGHGRIYQVRVIRTTGTGMVEISTQGSDTACVQYNNTQHLPVWGPTTTPTST